MDRIAHLTASSSLESLSSSLCFGQPDFKFEQCLTYKHMFWPAFGVRSKSQQRCVRNSEHTHILPDPIFHPTMCFIFWPTTLDDHSTLQIILLKVLLYFNNTGTWSQKLFAWARHHASSSHHAWARHHAWSSHHAKMLSPATTIGPDIML